MKKRWVSWLPEKNNHSNSSRIVECRMKHPRQWSRLQGWSYRSSRPARSSSRDRELANAVPVPVSSGNGAGVSKEVITFSARCFWRFVIQIQHSIKYWCAGHFMQASSLHMRYSFYHWDYMRINEITWDDFSTILSIFLELFLRSVAWCV